MMRSLLGRAAPCESRSSGERAEEGSYRANLASFHLKTHLTTVLALIAVIVLAGVVSASFLRYALFRPLWFVEGSHLPDAARRTARATRYIDDFKKGDVRLNHAASEQARLCVVIPTIARPTDYLPRNVASVLSASANKRRENDVRVAVIDMDDSPPGSPSEERFARYARLANLTSLRVLKRKDVLDDAIRQRSENNCSEPPFLTTEQTNLFREVGERAKKGFRWNAKESVDYAIALYWCASSTHFLPSSPDEPHRPCGYCMVLEDDSVVSRDAVDAALDAVVKLETLDPNWRLLKLYSTDYWYGWSTDDVFTIVAMFGLGACSFHLAVSAALFHHHHRRLRGTPPARGMLGVCFSPFHAMWALFGAFLLGFVPLMLGKQHLPYLGTRSAPGLARVQHDAGTVANLFSRAQARALCAEVTKYASLPGTMALAIDLYLAHTIPSEHRWEFIPNIADHVGFRSSSPDKVHGDHTYYHPHYVSSGTFRFSRGSDF